MKTLARYADTYHAVSTFLYVARFVALFLGVLATIGLWSWGMFAVMGTPLDYTEPIWPAMVRMGLYVLVTLPAIGAALILWEERR